ncbi:CLUMA_CG013383, isoform A [Clunio marinus]|uniref:CLUMA_CG013383, isoform A n=1 Tax=Clunio marinus TaxID=568069 RepID=A0A1J1IM04_9DIPT|nr:CLUMA_CG013383, isoform A [Clunio marinus]
MMRGDKKWPPERTRQQMLEDEETERKMAQGPSFRPKKAQKDYSQFFDQHKLNASFPGYKAAPGTQYFRTEYSTSTQFNGSNNSNSE